MKRINIDGHPVEVTERDFLFILNDLVDVGHRLAEDLRRGQVTGFPDLKSQIKPLITQNNRQLDALLPEIRDDALHGLIRQFSERMERLAAHDDRFTGILAEFAGLSGHRPAASSQDVLNRLQESLDHNAGPLWLERGDYQAAVEEGVQLNTVIAGLHSQIGERIERLLEMVDDHNASTEDTRIEGDQELPSIAREFERNIPYYEKKLSDARQADNKKSERAALGNLGISYSVLGQHELSVQYHEQALKIARELADVGNQAVHEHCLGRAYLLLGQTGEAIRHLTQARELYQSVGADNLVEDTNRLLEEANHFSPNKKV
jgi:tetratricopeptide (TPR) repeat protein